MQLKGGVMNRLTVMTLVAGVLIAGFAQRETLAAGNGETRSFDLHPTPPAAGEKHQLLVDAKDMRPGDAAVPLMRAALMLTPAREEEISKAMDARGGDAKSFDALAKPIAETSQAYLDLLADAACRERAEWDTGRERGIRALFPELNSMRELANQLSVIALYQIHQGQVDEAIATLRLEYELGRKVGQHADLIGNLVALGILSQANQQLAQLMNDPQSPNLYAALSRLPRPMLSLRDALEGERLFLIDTLPLLADAARPRGLTADQWREVYQQFAEMDSQTGQRKDAANAAKNARRFALDEQLRPGGVGEVILPLAQDAYTEAHQLPPGEAAEQEPAKVVAEFYFDQYRQVMDDLMKPLDLPYPEMIPQLERWEKEEVRQRTLKQPGNIFFLAVPSVSRTARSFLRIDRSIAALIAVEALRSYAAIHNGNLPSSLANVTETPVPPNPATGGPFDYRVTANTAVLSDSHPGDPPLQYTIRVQK
jgi:hypothetical protein